MGRRPPLPHAQPVREAPLWGDGTAIDGLMGALADSGYPDDPE